MNSLLSAMQEMNNRKIGENGDLSYYSTLNDLMDLFAFGGAYRTRSDEDCIFLFKKALEENETLALKCLFYLRDCREGQGERRFFRVVIKWLANSHPEMIERNFEQIAFLGRWDDFYSLVGTPIENKVFEFLYHQLALDVECKTPSLLAKWLKSENTSSVRSRQLGEITRKHFKMTPKQYRKTLSTLRERINIVERLMSSNRWNEIEFDKIPSKAGFKYRNAFARKDIIKAKYEKFAKDKTTTVNADTLYPHDIAHMAFASSYLPLDSPERLMISKYWDNLPNYYNGNQENGIAIVDVSGSMLGTPMEAAVSMGAYIADKAHGPFAGHFITFSAKPKLVKFEGVDIIDKFCRCKSADWGNNTNIQAVFDMLLNLGIKDNIHPEDMPNRIYIFSDMEFDRCVCSKSSENYWFADCLNKDQIDGVIEDTAKKWQDVGYEIPQIIFWNLNARNNTIPAIGPGFSYVSGFSPVMIETILSGKDGIDLMLEKLNSDRYSKIY